jgi:hypothetical protein
MVKKRKAPPCQILKPAPWQTKARSQQTVQVNTEELHAWRHEMRKKAQRERMRSITPLKGTPVVRPAKHDSELPTSAFYRIESQGRLPKPPSSPGDTLSNPFPLAEEHEHE